MLAPVLVTAPEITPISLADVKKDLRVEHTDDDDQITALIAAAVGYLDGYTGILGRCLVEQTWRQEFEAFAPCLPLPLAPLMSVESVEYDDDSGSPVTVPHTDYTSVVDGGGRASVKFSSGVTASGAVRITYKAGYPTVDSKSTAPDALKIAIVVHVKMNYYALSSDERASLRRTFDTLIAPYRRNGL